MQESRQWLLKFRRAMELRTAFKGPGNLFGANLLGVQWYLCVFFMLFIMLSPAQDRER